MSGFLLAVVFVFCNDLLLSREAGIDVFSLIGPQPGPNESGSQNVSDDLFKGQAVTLIHCHEKDREHDCKHKKERSRVSDCAP